MESRGRTRTFQSPERKPIKRKFSSVAQDDDDDNETNYMTRYGSKSKRRMLSNKILY